MIRLIYVSQARRDLTEADLANILASSVKHNTRLNITGILISHRHGFMQCLEGDRANVERVYAAILCDPRHRSIKTLSYDEIDFRLFTEWAMAHVNLDEKAAQAILARHKLNSDQAPHYMDASGVLQLVQAFSEHSGTAATELGAA
jgi:hypothetical protein